MQVETEQHFYFRHMKSNVNISQKRFGKINCLLLFVYCLLWFVIVCYCLLLFVIVLFSHLYITSIIYQIKSTFN